MHAPTRPTHTPIPPSTSREHVRYHSENYLLVSQLRLKRLSIPIGAGDALDRQIHREQFGY